MTFELRIAPPTNRRPSSGARAKIRGSVWKVQRVETDGASNFLHCLGLTGIVKGKTSTFIDRLEPDLELLDPANLTLVADPSSNFRNTKLYLEAAFRNAPPTGQGPLVLGKAAIDDLSFQHKPVEMALAQSRVRLLIADDVGLGKTLEAGLVASELILRHRADRILVVSTRAMLNQFQREFWTRFSIPLARLDSAAIKRMRNAIPSNYNVFDQFDRAIVSIDTLKKDLQYRVALENSRWDLIIIDEAHNVAARKSASGSKSQRAKLAELLAAQTDALLLLTATPHDGSAGSFASLIEMLDPTRVPDPDSLSRADIEDLVVRRFRSSPDVMADIRRHVPSRILKARHFPLSSQEDAAYDCVATLKLDLDSEPGAPSKAIDLFRTTLAKALFSSPMACLETVQGRLKRMAAGTAKGSDADRTRLETLSSVLESIGPDEFSKYQNLLALLKELNWTGRASRDRLVIFSERIATLEWLKTRLAKDLSLSDDAIGKVDGASVEADENTQKTLEDFGQEGSKIRILLASDMASEGLNLHFQSHRLIHFDLPWSLLRFQQRNGRIDRYGQDRQPEIYYFIGESTHERVRDMWVLDKLVAKDEAAQDGIGDPAVFLGRGDIEGEEEVVAEAIADGIGEDAFEQQLNARVAVDTDVTPSDDWDLLFQEYEGSQVPATSTSLEPPRLYPDTFSFAADMLNGLSQRTLQNLEIDEIERIIRFRLPDDLRANDAFGYSGKNSVDDRYMPAEALGSGERIELTDNEQAVAAAIGQARAAERAWPSLQYLWDVHPIVQWLGDRAESLFAHGEAPLCDVQSGLEQDEIAVLAHGSVVDKLGRPASDLWGVVILRRGQVIHIEKDVAGFLERIGFRADTPNPARDLKPPSSTILELAVEAFQTELTKARSSKQAELDAVADQIQTRLDGFKDRFDTQLYLRFGDSMNGANVSLPERAKLGRKAALERKTEAMFNKWQEWIATSCSLADDPNPHVDIKAVFRSYDHGV
ncbi:MAG: DEAD/DEAH box helicase [Pseudomonadota bacterium]